MNSLERVNGAGCEGRSWIEEDQFVHGCFDNVATSEDDSLKKFYKEKFKSDVF